MYLRRHCNVLNRVPAGPPAQLAPCARFSLTMDPRKKTILAFDYGDQSIRAFPALFSAALTHDDDEHTCFCASHFTNAPAMAIRTNCFCAY